MKKQDIIKELGIFIIDNALSENLSPLIYETLSHGKQIPTESYYLLPEKKYHKEIPSVYGFMFALSKLKEPPYYITLAVLESSARKIKLPFIGKNETRNLILYTLIIEFFKQNNSYLKYPEV